MTEQQIEIALSEHKEKIKELEYSYKTLGNLILVDKKILKFCSIQHLNYFWVKDVLKRFKDKFFIVTELEFLDFINELEDLNKSSKLFYLLSKLHLIRLIGDGKFLLTELLTTYIDLFAHYQLDSIMYSEEYSKIDMLSPQDAIAYYHNLYKEDSWWANEAFCNYYGYNYNDECTFTIEKI
jgi:hypothetical protein